MFFGSFIKKYFCKVTTFFLFCQIILVKISLKSKQIPRYTEFILNEVKGFARNDGVRVVKREKREATLSPLFFLPSLLKPLVIPNAVRDLLAIDERHLNKSRQQQGGQCNNSNKSCPEECFLLNSSELIITKFFQRV